MHVINVTVVSVHANGTAMGQQIVDGIAMNKAVPPQTMQAVTFCTVNMTVVQPEPTAATTSAVSASPTYPRYTSAPSSPSGPEFPSWLILPIALITLTTAIATRRKKY